MSYEIDYGNMDHEQAIKRALHDCREWLGTTQYNQMVEVLRADKGQTPRKLVFFGLTMLGIQGFPAQVMVDQFWSPQRELDFA